jgi:CubicO group peptidase (beta-lactamase class C family)
MSNHRKPPWRALAFAVTVFLYAPGVRAQDAAKDKAKPEVARPAQPAAKAGNVSDPADLEAFFDGVLPVQMESKHIAGAVVAVVVGDKLVFSKGYGYADVEARKKVDPEKTMFRIASVSKLFTWTAVMQQVEAGKLDLNADVNGYLKDVQIPKAFDQPITLTHLLTHTPGFEDYVIGLFGRTSEDVRPLAEVLRTQMPARVRPPGVISCYSNHGTALAGHAVACVSGMPWEDYIEKRILNPLGMEHTSVRQPAADKLSPDISRGYKWEKGHFAEKGFEYCPAAPAGCISMSAADAAKFMLAHLHDGQCGSGGRILQPETARRMRERLFWNDAKTDAMCYGFMEERRNGQRMVGHGGDTLWFHSLLQLIPERQVGVFVSYNTDTSGGVREALFDAFLWRYFPEADAPRVKAAAGARERADRLAGEYVMTRYSHTTVTKLAALLAVFNVSVNDDDTISVGLGDSSKRYIEVEPLVYQELDGPRKIVFQEGADGRGRYLFLADAPPVSAIRREWYDSSLAYWGLLAGSVGVFLSALFVWPAIGFSVRGLQSPRIIRTRFSGVLSCLAWLLSVAGVAFTAGLVYVLRDPNEIAFGLTPPLKWLLAATPACAVLAVLTVLGCLVAWRRRYWRLTGRLHYTLVALAGVGFTWFLYSWNLLTFGRLP